MVQVCSDLKYSRLVSKQTGALFKRTLTIDLPRGGRIPDDLLAVCMRTSGIEGYHDAVGKELAKIHKKLQVGGCIRRKEGREGYGCENEK